MFFFSSKLVNYVSTFVRPMSEKNFLWTKTYCQNSLGDGPKSKDYRVKSVTIKEKAVENASTEKATNCFRNKLVTWMNQSKSLRGWYRADKLDKCYMKKWKLWIASQIRRNKENISKIRKVICTMRLTSNMQNRKILTIWDSFDFWKKCKKRERWSTTWENRTKSLRNCPKS